MFEQIAFQICIFFCHVYCIVCRWGVQTSEEEDSLHLIAEIKFHFIRIPRVTAFNLNQDIFRFK
jgi:hypothetical protein